MIQKDADAEPRMTYRGHIENGNIVFDEPVDMPEGAKVKVDLCDALKDDEGQIPTLYERLKSVNGKAEGLPPGASVNVNHYLYGHPKVEARLRRID